VHYYWKRWLANQFRRAAPKRLAQILLTLANSGLASRSNYITIPIKQEMLANMVGTALAHQSVHEQISQDGLHRLQRAIQRQQFSVEPDSPRAASGQRSVGKRNVVTKTLQRR